MHRLVNVYAATDEKEDAKNSLQTVSHSHDDAVPKCGFKNIREFERGDYIFKEVEECPKCEEKMMISSIYREAEEEKD